MLTSQCIGTSLGDESHPCNEKNDKEFENQLTYPVMLLTTFKVIYLTVLV